MIFSVIETDYDFGSQSAYYVNLGANLDQTRLYLGVYGSMKVTDFNQGTVFLKLLHEKDTELPQCLFLD
ncbi:hypothetical protein GCM10020331_056490 [Ectobacillus funiculus]